MGKPSEIQIRGNADRQYRHSVCLTDIILIWVDNLLGPGLNFRWAGRVLVRSGRFPSRLLERELNCNGFTCCSDDMRAGLHSCVFVEGCWFIHFRVPESVRIVQGPARVHTRLGARFGASVDSGTVGMLARSSHGSTHVSLGWEAPFWRSSWELAGRGSRSGSVLHQVQNFN